MAERDESDLLTGEDRAFARAVKAARESRGWTQGDLTARLQAVGFEWISQVTVSRIEQGKRAARLGEAFGFAAAFDMPLGLLSAPDGRLAMLGVVLDRPREAEDALDRLREAAVDVGYLWDALGHDRDYAENLLADQTTYGEVDEDVTSTFELHRMRVDRLLSQDPVADVRLAFDDPDRAVDEFGLKPRRDG